MTVRWGIDISHYNNLPLAKVQELKDNGCSFAIIKGGGTYWKDPSFDLHINNFSQVGIPIGVYLWGDPIEQSNEQVDWFRAIMDPYMNIINCVMLDAEQFWTNWKDYWRYVHGEITIGEVPCFNPTTLSTKYEAMANRLADKFEKPLIIYSSGYFIQGFAPKMAGWMNQKNYPFCGAGYRYGPYPCTYAEFVAWTETLGSPFTWNVDSWEIWQVSSGEPFPQFHGMPRLDLDIIRDEAVYDYLFATGTEPPPPPPAKKPVVKGVTLYDMNIRTGPGTNYGWVGILPEGSSVEGLSISGKVWVEIAPGKWVCAILDKKYIELLERSD